MGAYLELRRGIGEPSFIPLSAGKELTIGRRGMWRVEAAGVLDVHAYVYFDGASLFVQSHDASAPVRVNGQDVGTDWLPLDRSCDIEIAGAVVGYAAEQAHADAEEATSIYDNAPIPAPPPMPAPLPPEQQTVALAQPAPIPPVNMRSTMAMDDAPRPGAPSGRPPPRNPNGPPPPPPTAGFANRPFPQPPGGNRPAEDSGATRLQPLPVPAPSAPAVRPAAGAPLPRMATGPSPVVQIAEDPLRATHFQPAVPPQNPGMMPMQPGMMQPGMMPPGTMPPGMMPPGMMQPGMMQPGMGMPPGMGMQPGMMQPGMGMQPGMPPGMDPNMMQPGMMQPGMMQPGMMQPGMGMPPGMGMQPGMMQPGMDPNMMQPGMMQPGMMQPGMQPGMPGGQLQPGAPGAKPSYAEQWKALSIPRKISILLSPFVLIACIDIFFFDEEEPAPPVALDAGAKPVADAGSTAVTTATTPPTMIVPPVFPDASFVEPPPEVDAGAVLPPPTGPTATPAKPDAGAPVVKPTDTTPKPMPTVRTLERQAADAYAAGRYEEAALLYDQLASQYPNDPTYKEIARIIRRRMSAPPQPK